MIERCLAVAVAGFLLAVSAAVPQQREVGEAVQTVGEVDYQEGRGSFEPLHPMDSVFLYWTLLTGHKSALAMKFYSRGGLLLGSGTRVEIVGFEGPSAREGCPTLHAEEGHLRLTIEPGIQRLCEFKVTTRDLRLIALGTDLALVVNRLYGTWVTVIEGTVRVELAEGDPFDLTKGEVALVRGQRVWRGRAVEPGSAPPGVGPPPLVPDPPLLPSVDLLPRAP